MGWLARVGLTARGLVYLLLGVLAVLVAVGATRKQLDQRGALITVAQQPLGGVLLVLLALGFLAYAMWRFSEVFVGVSGEGDGWGPRLKSLARGVAYLVLAVSAVTVLAGSRASQSKQQGHLAGQVMSHTGGRWLVGAVGLAIVVVGLVMVREGWSKKFLRYFGYLPSSRREIVVQLGRIGTVSRGLVFAVTGFLVVLAAWTHDPAKAGGVDEAFDTLLHQPYGRWLVVLLGAGLIVFGVYGLAEAMWRRVPGDSSDG